MLNIQRLLTGVTIDQVRFGLFLYKKLNKNHSPASLSKNLIDFFIKDSKLVKSKTIFYKNKYYIKPRYSKYNFIDLECGLFRFSIVVHTNYLSEEALKHDKIEDVNDYNDYNTVQTKYGKLYYKITFIKVSLHFDDIVIVVNNIDNIYNDFKKLVKQVIRKIR